MTKKTKLLTLSIALVFLLTPVVTLGINTLLIPKPAASTVNSPIRVACVGDSITQITGYPSDLQSMLGSNYSVGNVGSTGSTVLLNSWKPYMDQPQFQEAEAYDPQIVVIMLGTNDDLQSLQQYNESFEEDYAQIIHSFQQLQSNPQIYIASSPPIFSNDTDLSPSYLNNVIIPKTDALASQLNLTTIDVHDAFGNDSALVNPDGVHPNFEGAEVIASQVCDAITYQSEDQTDQTGLPTG